jgi:LPS-assembly protein
MFQSKRFLCCILLALICSLSVPAQQPENIEKKVENPIGVAEEQNKALRQNQPQQITIIAQVSPGASENVFFESDKQEGQGDVAILTGNVQVVYGDILVIADRATFNKTTNDLIAEGNVFFEQQGQRIAGERIELNIKTKRGTILTSTAFTNRTPDGTVLIVDSTRADKTGEDTFNLENVKMSACQERVPKWSFTAKRARLRLDHQAKAYNAFFRIKNIPIFYLPYASISVSKKDRTSGFLLPSSGSSTIKGRTFHFAYYQTLGRSADLLFRTDIFTKRGVGLGFDFRARTNENSKISFGSFIVLDRLFGEKGPDQGGSSFYADAVQRFKNGFVAVADINITSNPAFRQVFAENVQTAISPEERTILYLNRNWRSFSFNALFGEKSTFIYNFKNNTDEIVKVRQFPSLELSQRGTKVSESLPFYFSFDGALEGVRRSETVGDQYIFKTPSVTQRMDFFPRLTFPLRSLAGFTVTPSIGLRSTFYSDSLDPVQQQVTGQNLFRKYAEVNVDARPPALAKVYKHRDGAPWFKHIIEPFIEYRRIAGIDEFDRTLRIDERDVIADTNEITYGISNSFLVRRSDRDGSITQPHELLNVTLTQKYFFDPTFGGALIEGERNQFFPINTLSGFAFGGIRRNVSPLNFKARLRPTQSLFADLRFNYDTHFHDIRDFIVGAGIQRGIFSISQSWYYTRRIAVDQFRYDPATLPGNQLDFAAFVGNPARGPYGGIAVSYDLRDRQFNDLERDRRLINLTGTAGWAWDCCSLNVQYITFNAGLRNENRILFAFTLKGIGTFGTDSIGQRRRR